MRKRRLCVGNGTQVCSAAEEVTAVVIAESASIGILVFTLVLFCCFEQLYESFSSQGIHLPLCELFLLVLNPVEHLMFLQVVLGGASFLFFHEGHDMVVVHIPMFFLCHKA